MKIVIGGAGEVGSHLAKLLSREEQDIVVIDANANKLAPLDANYNLMTYRGNPILFGTLKDAGAGRADLYIAVTPSETANVTSCAIAKSLGAKRTVARIDNYEFMIGEHRPFFESIGVDNLIYPELLAAQEISTSLQRNWVRNWFELGDGDIILVGVKVRAGAQIVGQRLRDLAISTQHHVSAIKRRHDTIIPRGDDIVEAGDVLYFTTMRHNIQSLIQLCGKQAVGIRKIMIMGGSRIAIRLAALVGDRYKIKIIDNDMEKCRLLAERCPGCDIVYGDARSNELLIDERIQDQDAFIALTDSSETNILACLTAKEFGVKKTIAEVENLQFISEAEGLNIGTVINKKLLASSEIFQLMIDADVDSSKCLALTDAEVAQIEARKGSKITKGPVRELSLPREMTIAGAIREGHGMLVDGNTRIQAGDQVVVFCLSGSLHKIEKFFN